MRWFVAICVLLGGCDLVFELHEPTKSDAPFLDGFGARKAIDIELASMELDFPFMLHFVEDADLANHDPDEFEFTDADGVTKLDREIESYDPDTGDLIVWVRIPMLDNNRLFLYYDGAPVTGRDPRLTWSSIFAGVWHLGASDTILLGLGDSIGRNHLEAGSASPSDVFGLVGHGREFTETQDLTQEAVVPSTLDFGDTGSFSFSAWVFAASTLDTDSTPLARGSTGLGGFGIFLGADEWNASISSGTDFGGIEEIAVFSDQPILDDWTHLVAVVDRGNQELRTYVNGELRGTQSIIDVGSTTSTPPDLDLSRAASSEAYVGIVDEVRIYNAAITEGRIKAEHKNLTNATIVTFGTQETP
jgi:Concanavalin A-like lectin/glucanases superfamily